VLGIRNVPQLDIKKTHHHINFLKHNMDFENILQGIIIRRLDKYNLKVIEIQTLKIKQILFEKWYFYSMYFFS